MTLLYKRPDSPFFYVTRTRESTKTSNRKQAEEFARKSLSAVWRAEELGEEIHTWKELKDTWLDIKADKRSLNRDEGIIEDFDEFLLPRQMGDLSPLGLLSGDVLRKYGALVKARASASTANRNLACLRSMLNKAAEYEWIPKCPAIEMYEVVEKEPRWFRPEEFDRISAALPEGIVRDIAEMGLQTGMRFSNVAGLRWDWITEDGLVALVPAVSAKTKRLYTVPLSTRAREIVARWRAVREDSPFVFTRDGERLKTIRFWWEQAFVKTGIKYAPPHTLRHTFASWHTRNETPDRVLQAMGGWSSAAMLKRYGHHEVSHLTKYADNLNANDTAGEPK